MDLLTAAAEAAQAQQKQVVEIREQLSSLAEQLAEERAVREAEAAKFRADRVAFEAKLVAEHAARPPPSAHPRASVVMIEASLVACSLKISTYFARCGSCVPFWIAATSAPIAQPLPRPQYISLWT